MWFTCACTLRWHTRCNLRAQFSRAAIYQFSHSRSTASIRQGVEVALSSSFLSVLTMRVDETTGQAPHSRIVLSLGVSNNLFSISTRVLKLLHTLQSSNHAHKVLCVCVLHNEQLIPLVLSSMCKIKLQHLVPQYLTKLQLLLHSLFHITKPTLSSHAVKQQPPMIT